MFNGHDRRVWTFVDIKGELSEATAELFKSKGCDVYFLDFLNPDNSNCWNPLYLGAKEYIKQLEIEKKEKKKFEKEMHSVIKEYEILHGNVTGIDLESFFGKDEAGDYIYKKESDTFKTARDL
ncbi:type IV secretory system conjugative DNA transfer family protein [Thomasclavelia spiroformis]|uniref:type IV secretory system conjugative DNA transfer family protein n=1 Tax=Thomasclavelia spiroformis TaxID=29348 RepID=UPI00241F4D87|nr:type IV secretory system conjugative DNA transfer family protein [Thomasclavelia spiroformis]